MALRAPFFDGKVLGAQHQSPEDVMHRCDHARDVGLAPIGPNPQATSEDPYSMGIGTIEGWRENEQTAGLGLVTQIEGPKVDTNHVQCQARTGKGTDVGCPMQNRRDLLRRIGLDRDVATHPQMQTVRQRLIDRHLVDLGGIRQTPGDEPAPINRGSELGKWSADIL